MMVGRAGFDPHLLRQERRALPLELPALPQIARPRRRSPDSDMNRCRSESHAALGHELLRTEGSLSRDEIARAERKLALTLPAT